jgi:hypothetical protein
VKPEHDLMSLAGNVSRPLPVLARLAVMLRNMAALKYVFAKFASLRRRDKVSDELPVSTFVDEGPVLTRETVDQPMADSTLADDAVIAEPKPDDGVEREALACDAGCELPLSRSVEQVPGITQERVDQPKADSTLADDIVIAEPKPDHGLEHDALTCDVSGELPLSSSFAEEAPGVTPDVDDLPIAHAKLSDEMGVAEPVTIAEPELDARSLRENLIRRRWIETGIKMWNPDIHGAGRAALNIQGRVGVLPVIPGERLPGYDKLEFALTDGTIVCEGVAVEPPKRRR